MIRPGNLFVVSAASGTGKTSLMQLLLRMDEKICNPISYTTRAPRGTEEHGKHYYFVDEETFKTMIGEGAFLEHACVYGNFYGTSMAEVERLRQAGFDVVLEIDVQGAMQVRHSHADMLSIFILPPSVAVLTERIRGRATDSEEVIQKRLKHARVEFEAALSFDYLVVNDDLEDAATRLHTIIRASRQLEKHQEAFLVDLLNEFDGQN